MISDAASIRQTLFEWSAAAKLNDAVLSKDGTSLTLTKAASSTEATANDDVVGVVELDATAKLTVTTAVPTESPPADTAVAVVEHSAVRSCEYTAAAIFLQIRDPDQGLVAYRNACKLHAVADPVKALDKALVVAFFIQQPSAAVVPADDSTAAAAATDLAATDADIHRKHQHDKEHRDRAREREKRKHHHEKRKSSDPHHRGGSSSSARHGKEQPHPQSNKKKKKADMVTNEQLFEHLNVVVDKRGTVDTAMVDAITTALSAKGFEITGKEQLEPYKEKTAAILANEIPVGNSASILRANNPRKDLSRVLELFMETTVSDSNKHKGGGKPPMTASQSQHQAANNSKKGNIFKPYLVGKKPVIVVPKGMTAPLTLVNAHEFLCYGRFVPRDVMMKQQKGLNQTPPTTFTRTIHNGLATSLLEYEITDNPHKLGPHEKEWERIVAVIVLGQSWQFKDWLKQPVAYNVPATLFDRVYGFYVQMEGDKIPSDVTGWAVHKAQLNREKRNLDSVTYASFWNGLDEWMKVYKAELLPQADN